MIKHDPLKFPSPDWDHISPTAKDFCKALMQKAPRDRMNAKDAMNHPWIKERSTVHAGRDGGDGDAEAPGRVRLAPGLLDRR